MRVVFRSLGHWEQQHDLDAWPAVEDVVELKTDDGDVFYKVSGVKWVLTPDGATPSVVVDLVLPRYGRSI